MANDLNKFIGIGRLTRDPELKQTPSGTSVCNFSIANNRSYSSGGETKEQTNFFDCIAWSKLGEIIAEHCKKGQMIGIDGRLDQRRWDDDNGNKRSKIGIVVENFQFLSKKNDSGQESVKNAIDNNPFSDNEIPW